MPSVSQLFQPSKENRYHAIDVLRGMAVVLMIIFHFGYDLTVFGYAHYNTVIDMPWRIFRAVIVSSFLLAMGMSSYLAYHREIDYRKLLRTLIKLAAVSTFISISSYIMYPQHWVYFGIIHFATVALPASLWFIHKPRIALVSGVIILTGYFSDVLSLTVPWNWAVKHLHIPQVTVDLVSVVPWFGVVLLGIFLIHYRLIPSVKPNKFSQILAFLGQHTLVIYLIHQPILFACFSLYQWIFAVASV